MVGASPVGDPGLGPVGVVIVEEGGGDGERCGLWMVIVVVVMVMVVVLVRVDGPGSGWMIDKLGQIVRTRADKNRVTLGRIRRKASAVIVEAGDGTTVIAPCSGALIHRRGLRQWLGGQLRERLINMSQCRASGGHWHSRRDDLLQPLQGPRGSHWRGLSRKCQRGRRKHDDVLIVDEGEVGSGERYSRGSGQELGSISFAVAGDSL